MDSNVNQMIQSMFTSDFSGGEESWEDQVKKETGEDFALPEPDENGDYETPALMIIRDMWDGFLDKEVKEEELRENINEMLREVEERMEMIKAGVEEMGDAEDNEVNVAVSKAFDLHKKGLDMTLKFFESGDEEMIGRGIDLVQQGTNMLMKGLHLFREALIREITVYCPSCESPNPRGSRRCQTCGFELPLEIVESLPDSEMDITEEGISGKNMPMTTDNYDQMETAVETWKNRQISDDQLLANINEVEGRFLAHKNGLKKEQSDVRGLTEKEQEIFLGMTKEVESALDMNLETLAGMKEYFKDNNRNHIERGMEKLWDATQAVVKSYKTTEELDKWIKRSKAGAAQEE